MGDVLSLLNKIAFVIAPVFWNLVYRSMVAVIFGCVYIAVTKIADEYISPKLKQVGMICIVAWILILPDYNSPLSVMKPLSPVAEISYRQEYDIVQQQVHIAIQNDGDDMIDGLTDSQLMEKEKEIFYKSLAFDVIIPFIWLLGVAVCLLWIVVSTCKLNKKIKISGRQTDLRIQQLYNESKAVTGVKKDVVVLFTDFVNTPATFGYFRPRILLPEYVSQMDDEQIKHILMHELAHIKRGDISSVYLHSVLHSIYWFNPFIKLLTDYSRQVRELMADAVVVEKTADKNSYIKTIVYLLSFNTDNSASLYTISMGDNVKNMKQRITNIKQHNFYKKYSFVLTALSIAAIVVLWMFLGPAQTDRETNPSADFDKGIYSNTVATPENWVSAAVSSADNSVTMYCNIPENWTFGTEGGTDTASGLPVPYMAFHNYDSSLNIYEDGKLIGYVFFCRFTPYTEEIPAQQYYQTVWTDLRLSSMCIWDPFTSLKQWETGESGTADIYFTDMEVMDRDNLTNAEAPHYTTKGVLAYDKAKEYYIGFGFAPNTVSDQTIIQIADSIEF